MDLEDIGGLVDPGMYRHFKGNEYTVLFCARHSEDLGVLVVYKETNGVHVWARPIEEFLKPLPDGSDRFVRIK